MEDCQLGSHRSTELSRGDRSGALAGELWTGVVLTGGSDEGPGQSPFTWGGDDDENEIIQAFGDEPTPDMVLIMEEFVERLIAHLGVGQLRELAVARLERISNAEIAVRFECSERTIGRRLHLIREKCQ